MFSPFGLDDRLAHGDRRVGHGYVNAAELFDRGFEHGCDGVAVGYVGLPDESFAAQLADLIGRALGFSFVRAVIHDHIRALLGQAEGDTAPDS